MGIALNAVRERNSIFLILVGYDYGQVHVSESQPAMLFWRAGPTSRLSMSFDSRGKTLLGPKRSKILV